MFDVRKRTYECSYGFSLWRQMVPQQSAKLNHMFSSNLTQFEERHVAIYRSIWRLFPPCVRDLDVLYNALNIS